MQRQLEKVSAMNSNYNVDHIDLSAEIERMTTRAGLEPSAAEEAAQMYRKFLALCAKYKKGLTPSKLIDAAWHEHMADTRKYTDDCVKLCGTFIHHDPKITGNRMEEQFKYTNELFMKEFGIDLTKHSRLENRVPMSCGM